MKKVILILVITLLFTGCATYKGISYKEYLLDNKLVLYFNNDNDYCIDISFKVYFYDDSNYEIFKIEKEYKSIVEGNSIIDFGEVKKYDHYKIVYDYKKSKTCIDTKNISIDKEEHDGFIKVKINNKYSKKLNLNIGTIFYKNNEIVSYDGEDTFIIDSNKSVDSAFYYPSSSFNNLEFDNYKIIINQAY